MSSVTIASLVFALLLCVAAAAPMPECGENEYFNGCSGCDSSCADLGILGCPLICNRPGACRCEDGFARDAAGKCVRRESCPALECPAGEVWEACGGCETFCFDTKPFCVEDCLFSRCVCPEGTVRNYQNECVALEQGCGKKPIH